MLVKKYINKVIEKISIMLIMIGVSILWSVHQSKPTYTVKKIEHQEKAIEQDSEFISLYKEYPQQGDYIGTLEMQKLSIVLPIYQGTDDEELKNGVGHFIKSAMPGENNNSVMSGHRNTVFKELDKLAIGDLIIIETKAGKFTYQVVQIKIVDKNDKSVIVYTDHSVLTLTTCYPFQFLASTDERYVVIADLMDKKL